MKGKQEQEKKNFNLRINDRVKKSEFEERLKAIDDKLTLKVSISKRWVGWGKVEDRESKTKLAIQELQRHLKESVNNLEDKTTSFEKNLTWRISDCEQLLKTRVN